MEYSKILWTELIGFDNSQPDCGVAAYLANLGMVPEAISIFMWGSDFVHQHQERLPEVRVFPPDVGCYMDVYYDAPKFTGTPWTSEQLKTVIANLHKAGVKVLFSIFPTSLMNRWHREFLPEHPEIAYNLVSRNFSNELTHTINPVKRFADGTYYEDFLITKACQVIQDYGFDGWHLADGYNHTWHQIDQGDFSDDLLEQFLNDDPSIVWPAELPRRCENEQAALNARGEYIWKNLRLKWIAFYCRRWERFLGKLVVAVHRQGALVFSNTEWCRDPLEALYRYGIDLRHVKQLGIDQLVIETVGCCSEIMNTIWKAKFAVPFFNVVLSSVLLSRAAGNCDRFCSTTSAQDITEGWSALHYAPGFLEKEITCYANLCIRTQQGVQRCCKGTSVCLAEQILPHEWHWLKECWDRAYAFPVAGLGGVTLVWSDAAMDAELENYAKTREMHTAAILYHLYAKGVPVQSVVRIEDLAGVSGPLLAINCATWPEAEQHILAEYRRGPLYAVGKLGNLLPQPQLEFQSGLEFRLFNAQAKRRPPELPAVMPVDVSRVEEPLIFFQEEFFQPVPEEFFQAVADVIGETDGREFHICEPDHEDNWAFRFWEFALPDGTRRAIIHNDFTNYIFGEFTTEHELSRIIIRSPFRGRPIWLDPRQDKKPGNQCFIKIPPKGVGIIDAVYQTPPEDGTPRS